MIKSILSAIVLSTVATGAMACADLREEGNRIMPTTLSAHQECLVDTIFADEAHGSFGELVWVRAGAELVVDTKSSIRNNDGERMKRVIAYKVEQQVKEVIKTVTITDEYGVERTEYALDTSTLEGLGLSPYKTADVVKNEGAQKFLGNNDKVYDSISDALLDDDVTSVHAIFVDATASVTMNGTTINLTLDYDFNSIVDQIVEMANESFDQGYEDGYADGYADGFRDGYNSVMNAQ